MNFSSKYEDVKNKLISWIFPLILDAKNKILIEIENKNITSMHIIHLRAQLQPK